MNNRIWECDYKHTRRKHRHRCHVCSRILQEGDRVTMWRWPTSRGTTAFHAYHNDERHSPTYTWLQVATVWANGGA